MINAHESSLASLALNSEGLLLATASDKVRTVLKLRGHLFDFLTQKQETRCRR